MPFLQFPILRISPASILIGLFVDSGSSLRNRSTSAPVTQMVVGASKHKVGPLTVHSSTAAPSKLFKLENADDPLLFAPIGNGYYYLVHKWGNDLNPFRRLLMWPYKSFGNLIFTTLLVSLFATGLVPDGLFSNKMISSQTGMIFFFMFLFKMAL